MVFVTSSKFGCLLIRKYRNTSPLSSLQSRREGIDPSMGFDPLTRTALMRLTTVVLTAWRSPTTYPSPCILARPRLGRDSRRPRTEDATTFRTGDGRSTTYTKSDRLGCSVGVGLVFPQVLYVKNRKVEDSHTHTQTHRTSPKQYTHNQYTSCILFLPFLLSCHQNFTKLAIVS